MRREIRIGQMTFTTQDEGGSSTDSGIVRPGIRVVHDSHGRGVVMQSGSVVVVRFPDLDLTWDEILKGVPHRALEDLEVQVPIRQILEGDVWNADPGPDMPLDHVVRYIVTTRASRFDDLASPSEMLESLRSVSGDVQEAVTVIVVVVDWSVIGTHRVLARNGRIFPRAHSDRIGKDFWNGFMRGSLPSEITAEIDSLLSYLSKELTETLTVEGVIETGKTLGASIEDRVSGIHGRLLTRRPRLSHRT